MSFQPRIVDLLRKRKSEILLKAEEYGVSDIRIFGSVIRNEESSTSDVDLLIEVNQADAYESGDVEARTGNNLLKRRSDVELPDDFALFLYTA